MAKIKSAYFCQSCGYESAKWLGKCPSCGAWNSFAEEVVIKASNPPGGKTTSNRTNKPVRIDEIAFSPEYRIPTSDAELDRVLGGGIVPGSLVLLGGEPGIGKSTL
ncbi:MAG TPA: DNA repair protein RadA, partial [Anseongella sp.]|nr:DNA repair protein RadA [Anseongella sp.]